MPEGLIPLERRFRSLLKRAELDRSQGVQSVYVSAASVATALLGSQKDQTVLHGDMHHENVLCSEIRGWLAIDPKGLWGERAYDAANVLCNPDIEELVADEARLMRNATILAEVLKLELSRLLAFTFAHAALSACWSLEDGQNSALALKVAAILEPHVLA